MQWVSLYWNDPGGQPFACLGAKGAHCSVLSDDSDGVDIPRGQLEQTTVPLAAVNEPLGHAVQDGAAPAWGENVPGPHSVHDDAPGEEKDPAGHARHWFMPVLLA